MSEESPRIYTEQEVQALLKEKELVMEQEKLKYQDQIKTNKIQECLSRVNPDVRNIAENMLMRVKDNEAVLNNTLNEINAAESFHSNNTPIPKRLTDKELEEHLLQQDKVIKKVNKIINDNSITAEDINFIQQVNENKIDISKNLENWNKFRELQTKRNKLRKNINANV